MKLISWNVNGLRACIQKGFLEQFDRLDADFFCLQETKLQEGQIQLELPGYEQYWCYAEKKGYSGTAIFTKHTPLSVSYGIGVEQLDNEGRVITLEYPEFYLVTCYTPNAQRGLARIDHRMKWDDAFRAYLKRLDEKHPVIICGDLNVAHQEIDLKNPQSNRGNAGFSDQERESFTKTLGLGFTDTFRYLRPDATGIYSWWSYMYNARENNAGWRIDYFLVSDRIKEQVFRTPIYTDIMGSDHCPVGLELDILCNGSMWSPSSMGKARDVTPEPKKKAPASARAVLSFALIFAVLMAGIFAGRWLFPGDASPATEPAHTDPANSATGYTPLPTYGENDLFSITVYQEPLLQTNFTPSPVVSMFWECLTKADELYLLGSASKEPPAGTILNIEKTRNFWVRIELTQKGFQHYNKGDFPTLISLSTAPDGLQSALRAYYYQDDLRNIAGWFFYGYTPEAAQFEVIFAGERTAVQIDPISSPTSDNLFILHKDEYIEEFQWKINGDNPQHWKEYTDDQFNHYLLLDPIQQDTDPRKANFVLRLELTEQGKQLANTMDLRPYAQSIYTSSFALFPVTVQPYTEPYYGPGIAGYIIYGHINRSDNLCIWIGDDVQHISITPVPLDSDLYRATAYTSMPVWGEMTEKDQAVPFFFDGTSFFKSKDLITEDSTQPYNLFVRISLTEQGKEYFKALDIPTVQVLIPPGGTESDAKIHICSYYTTDAQQREGWIIYGHASRSEEIMLTLLDRSAQIHAHPTLGADEDFDIPVDDG